MILSLCGTAGLRRLLFYTAHLFASTRQVECVKTQYNYDMRSSTLSSFSNDDINSLEHYSGHSLGKSVIDDAIKADQAYSALQTIPSNSSGYSADAEVRNKSKSDNIKEWIDDELEAT